LALISSACRFSLSSTQLSSPIFSYFLQTNTPNQLLKMSTPKDGSVAQAEGSAESSPVVVGSQAPGSVTGKRRQRNSKTKGKRGAGVNDGDQEIAEQNATSSEKKAKADGESFFDLVELTIGLSQLLTGVPVDKLDVAAVVKYKKFVERVRQKVVDYTSLDQANDCGPVDASASLGVEQLVYGIAASPANAGGDDAAVVAKNKAKATRARRQLAKEKAYVYDHDGELAIYGKEIPRLVKQAEQLQLQQIADMAALIGENHEIVPEQRDLGHAAVTQAGASAARVDVSARQNGDIIQNHDAQDEAATVRGSGVQNVGRAQPIDASDVNENDDQDASAPQGENSDVAMADADDGTQTMTPSIQPNKANTRTPLPTLADRAKKTSGAPEPPMGHNDLADLPVDEQALVKGFEWRESVTVDDPSAEDISGALSDMGELEDALPFLNVLRPARPNNKRSATGNASQAEAKRRRTE
ncbi:hypothetical protein F4861DRAFT_546210, partial [Xylaria intraflava]